MAQPRKGVVDKKNWAQRPGPHSPYMRRKMALGTATERRLMPTRDYSPNNLTTLREFHHDFRAENGGRCKSDPPKTPHHQFYRLPEHLRDQATLYYEQLCRKWAKRIKATPNFSRILHMVTLNKFKNPGQAAKASYRGTQMVTHRRQARIKMEQQIYSDPQQHPNSGKITYNPTF